MIKNHESKSDKVRDYTIIAVVLSIIAFLVSMAAVMITCYRKELYSLSLDYQGIYVAIFSVLVTLLIGWNIYNLVDFNRKAKELDVLKKQQESLLHKINIDKDTNKYATMVYSVMCQADAQMGRKNYATAIRQYVQVLYSYEVGSRNLKSEISQICEDALKNLSATFRLINADKKVGDRIILDYDLEYDAIFNEYKRPLLNNNKYVTVLDLTDSFINVISESVDIDGVYFKLFYWNTTIFPRRNAIYILFNESKTPLLVLKKLEDVKNNIKKDIDYKYRYIGAHCCENNKEKEDVISKIFNIYPELNIEN